MGARHVPFNQDSSRHTHLLELSRKSELFLESANLVIDLGFFSFFIFDEVVEADIYLPLLAPTNVVVFDILSHFEVWRENLNEG